MILMALTIVPHVGDRLQAYRLRAHSTGAVAIGGGAYLSGDTAIGLLLLLAGIRLIVSVELVRFGADRLIQRVR